MSPPRRSTWPAWRDRSSARNSPGGSVRTPPANRRTHPRYGNPRAPRCAGSPRSAWSPSLPPTRLPRLLTELAALAGRAGLCAPFALQPYADNYTGTTTASVLPAARVSAELLHGTPYARYYGIDFTAVWGLARADDREGFERLCAERAGLPRPGRRPEQPPPSPALTKDPAMVEQVRILTAGNLAPLVREFGVVPHAGWDSLARASFTEARRRGATAKRTARAWRHLLFHLSQCDTDRRAAVLDWIDSETARLPVATAARLAPLIADTRRATA
ncbi:hypothetical protein [Streptomyces sp. NPDC059957]|uniref:hypothetical protein n=1 Tax=unclassified Streptomyces TaxID=2593676 RepID=UPI0036481A08